MRQPPLQVQRLAAEAALFLFPVLLAAALRFHAIQIPFFYSDEAFSWRVAREPWLELLRRAGGDTHPPVHFLLLKLWMKLFGESAGALRALSASCSVLCVPLVYMLLREAYGRSRLGAQCGIVAAILTATSVIQITHGRVARMYAVGGFFFLVTCWLLLRAVRGRSARSWLAWSAYGLGAVTFLLVHNFAIFSIAGQFLFLFLEAWRRAWRREWEELRQLVKGAALAAFVIGIVYSPWLPVFLEQSRRTTEFFWISPLGGWETLVAMSQWTLGFSSSSPDIIYIAVAFMIFCVVFGCWRCGDCGRLLALSFVAPWLFAVLISWQANRPILQERYFVFATLAFLGLAGSVCGRLPWRFARGAMAFVLIATFCDLAARYVATFPHQPAAMETAVDSLRARRQTGDVVTVDWIATVNTCKFYAAQHQFDPDVRVFIPFTATTGQGIHTASLSDRDVITDEKDLPPANANRWWQLTHAATIEEPAPPALEAGRDFNLLRPPSDTRGRRERVRGARII